MIFDLRSSDKSPIICSTIKIPRVLSCICDLKTRIKRINIFLQIAIQEQLNIREGRPSMYAASADARVPQVVNDRFLQHVFSAHMPGGRGSNDSPPSGITGFLGYLVNCVFQFCYSTLSSLVTTLLNIFRSSERSKYTFSSK